MRDGEINFFLPLHYPCDAIVWHAIVLCENAPCPDVARNLIGNTSDLLTDQIPRRANASAGVDEDVSMSEPAEQEDRQRRKRQLPFTCQRIGGHTELTDVKCDLM